MFPSFRRIQDRAPLLAGLFLIASTGLPAQALEVAQNSRLQIESGVDGLRIRSAREVSRASSEQILVDCRLSRLVATDLQGRPVKTTERELWRKRNLRRVALEVPEALLQEGLQLREEGPPVQPRESASLRQAPRPEVQNYRLRISVDSEGLYRLGYTDLLAVGDGLTPAGLGDPRRLKLFLGNEEVPLRITGESDGSWDPGDQLEFWAGNPGPAGEGFGPDTRRDPWSDEWCYFLAAAATPGLRMGQESAAIVETDPGQYRNPRAFYSSAHFEEDLFHSQLGFVLGEERPDHFFWDISIRAGQLRSFPFVTPGIDTRSTDPVRLTLCLRGGSAPSSGDPYSQRVQAYVNGSSAQALDIGADGSWQNQELVIQSFGEESFPDHQGFQTENTLTIVGLELPPANAFSNAMLNWFDVEYKRSYRADEEQLVFSVDPEYTGQLVDLTISGFGGEDIQLYKIGQSRMFGGLVRPESGGFRLRLQDVPASGDRYIALRETAKKTPLRVEAWEPRDLRAPGDEGLLVIVADSLLRENGAALLDPLQPLWQRDAGGARILSDYWIYDQFGDGRVNPSAIRAYLRHVESAWPTPPGKILLLGDGALEQHAIRRESLPVLPIQFEQVYRWGAAANDTWYVSGSGGVESAALISRWPVKSPEELQNMVAKRLAYDQAPAGEWMNSTYFISASRVSEGDIFIEQRESLVNQNIPEDIFVRRLDVGLQDSPYDGLTTELIRQFDRGAVLCNYFGHGGGAVWYDFNLLRSDDVSRFNNDQVLPLITNTTCHIASIELEDALGKALLNAGPMGAIGVLGASGLSFFYASMELIRLYYDFQLANPELPVAGALRLAEDQFRVDRLSFSNDSLTLDIADTVIRLTQFLGDPSQRLRIARSGAQVTPPSAETQAGASLSLQGQSSLADAQGRLEFYSSLSHPVVEGGDFIDGIQGYAFQTDAAGNWSLEAEAPSTLYPLGLWSTARVLVYDDEQAERGSSTLFYGDSLQTGWMSDAVLVPEFPQAGEAIELWITAAAPEGVDSLSAAIRAYTADGDSLDLDRHFLQQQENPVRWKAETTIGPFPDETDLRVIYTLYSAGEAQASNPTWFRVEERRAQIVGELLGHGESEEGRVALRLRNRGRGDLASVELRLLNAAGDSLDSWFAGPLAAGEALDSSFHLGAGRLGETVRLQVDPGFAQSDSATAGTFDLQLAELALEIPSGQGERRREVLPGLELRVTGTEGTRIRLRDLSVHALERQPGLQLHTALLAADVYEGSLQGLGLAVDTSRVPTDPGVWTRLDRDPLLALALPLSSVPVYESGFLVYPEQPAAGIGLGRLADSESPAAELSVENQVFRSGDYVPDRPAFSWLLLDANGIDSRSLALSLDGAPVDSSAFSLEPVGQGNNLLLRFAPELEQDGEERNLALSFSDAAGNPASEDVSFTASDRFGLQYLGAYPTPFKNDTRFVYNLSGVADRVEVRIYTVSGRKIRTLLREGPVINYDEIYWDGRDEGGAVIANGVYFYLFKATGGRGEITRRGKLAKLK